MDFNFVVTVKNRIRAWWKWFLSLFKRDWNLSDYPISVREHEIGLSYVGTRLKVHRYTAQIVNWWVISGGGDTKTEALQELQKSFATVKAEKAKDPVCGLMVDKNPELSANYKGETYYFCTKTDLEQFKKAPEKYVKK